jgi:DNA-binding MarR family transcriptional regulator
MPNAVPQPKFAATRYQALADFRYALRRFFAFSEQAADAAGLSPRQYQALLAILGARGNLGIGDMAERLMIRHHTAGELVNRLEANGFVARTKDRDDARRVYVMPTAKAERLMAGLASAHLVELKGIRPVLEQLLDQFDALPAASASRPAKTSARPRQRGRRTNASET